MSGQDPRGWFTKTLYRISKSARKALDQGWKSQAGTPPPWTPQGKRHADAQAKREALLKSPPPLEGDSRWMSVSEARALAAQVIGDDTDCDYITLGYVPDRQAQDLIPVVSPAPGHILTIAATRAGKGATQIVPNLLTYQGSMVIIDPKGENYAMTHAHRRKFSRVLRVDPFRITEGWDAEAAFSKFNPMEFITDASAARRLARALLGEMPQGDNQFWYQEAANLLTGILLYVVEVSQTPTLGKFRDLLSKPEADLLKILENAARTTQQRVVKTAFNRFIGSDEKLRSGVLSQINASTAIWDEPAMLETVSACHFSFANMRDMPLTVYIILPFDKLHSHSAFLKLIVSQFYQAMITPAPPPKLPVVCLIDEFPALGRMDELVKALGEIAGYGVRFWLFAQGLNQLKSIYPKDWETILAQCATQSYFGITDPISAELLSKQLGNKTVAYEVPANNYSEGGIDDRGYTQANTSVSAALNFKGVPLASPNEIRRQLGVGRSQQVIFQSGHDPIVAERIAWFDVPEMAAVVPDLRNMPVAAPSDVRSTIPKKVRRRQPTGDEKALLDFFEQEIAWKGTPEGHVFGIRDAEEDET